MQQWKKRSEMCIICNCGDAGEDFLNAFASASHEMVKAKNAMLKCKLATVDPEAARQYDKVAKAMARLIRDWRRLEQEREAR